MAGLDLSLVRGVLDELIFEGAAVLITEDNGVTDAVLNEEGDLVEPPGHEVYSGAGVILPVTSFGAGMVPDLGVAVTPTDSEATHKLLLPLTAPAGIRLGQQVTQTTVNPITGDVQLVGRLFEVTERPTNGAVAVLRIAFLKPARSRQTPVSDPEL